MDAARANTLPDPGAALALEVVTGALGVETAEVLLAGPDGGLERLGSVVSPASDAEILEVLASLQFEGGRVVGLSDVTAEGGDEAPAIPGVSDAASGEVTGASDGATSGTPIGASEAPSAPSSPSASPRGQGPRALPGSEALPVLAGSEEVPRDETSDDEDDEEGLEDDLRASAGRRQTPVPTTLIALDRLDEDTTFRIREEGDISRLATDLARVGQLFPIDVRQREGDRLQVICGFRRLAALRFLHREFVMARVHVGLRDEDAQLMALAAAIHAEPVEDARLEAVREELEAEGRLVPAVRDMLDKALAEDDGLAPELAEEEIDADELASDVSQRLGTINQELSMLADVFASLEPSRQAELLMQLRYASELVAYLEGQAQ